MRNLLKRITLLSLLLPIAASGQRQEVEMVPEFPADKIQYDASERIHAEVGSNKKVTFSYCVKAKCEKLTKAPIALAELREFYSKELEKRGLDPEPREYQCNFADQLLSALISHDNSVFKIDDPEGFEVVLLAEVTDRASPLVVEGKRILEALKAAPSNSSYVFSRLHENGSSAAVPCRGLAYASRNYRLQLRETVALLKKLRQAMGK